MNNKIIHHLSHTDLDGYSCQLVMKQTPYTLFNYNANYGAEVKQTLELILQNIKKDDKEASILITDLNLNTDEAKWLNAEVEKLNEKGKKITLKLLDHHGTGEESANKYNWYYLDTSRCATKITYDYAKEHFEFDEPAWMEKFVNIVNAVDLWKMEEKENFEYGKVCMRLVSEMRELNKVMFAQDDNFFKKDHDDTLDNLATEYIVELLGRARDEKTIYYKGYRGYLSYGVGNTSIIGNGFLLAYPEYDFIVDISYRGTLSIRANNTVNVALISKEWTGGGGHPNAAGGRIVGFKEQYRYDKVKAQIEKIINEKESVAGELEYKKEG